MLRGPLCQSNISDQTTRLKSFSNSGSAPPLTTFPSPYSHPTRSSRFGDPKYCKDSQIQFARNFQKHCATKFLQSYLNVLNSVREGGYLPDRVINLALSYLTHAIPKKEPYQLMKQHMDVVLFQIVFPLICFNQQDEELWLEDPHEYVRKGYGA